jgi:hypothetical protein
MSYRRAMDALCGRPVDRVAHLEILDHPQFMRELIGWDPWTDPLRAYVESYQALDVDWVIGLPRRAARFERGESSKAGADGTRITEWGLSGSSWREDYLFHDVEDVLAYDPLANQPRVDLVTPEHHRRVIESRRADQALMGDSAVVSGIHYTTLFQLPIMVFGWPLFLTAAAAEPESFQRVLEGFAQVTRRNMEAWAAEDLPLMLVHDDIAMERSLVFHPDWYRRRLFPLYEALLAPLKARRPALKVAFVSDGDYTAVLDDLAALGFDGFMINPNMDLAAIARRLGGRAFLMGNVSTNVLTFGTPDDVRRAVRKCIEAGKPAAGHFLRAGGDLPHNIPLDNLRAYFAGG